MARVDLETAARLLLAGGVGVIPTDTVYGLVASIGFPEAVERIYRIKKRDPAKACLVLISKIKEVENFNCQLGTVGKKMIDDHWPGPVSLVFDLDENEDLEYIHRGLGSLALRCPDHKDLCQFLDQTGPVLAPSANPEGLSPARTVDEAEAYFGKLVDFYVDGGLLTSEPSSIIKVSGSEVFILR